MRAKSKKLPSQNLTLTSNSENLQTFSEHVKELRTRLIWVALVFILLSALAYNYREILVDIILNPLDNQKLVYLTPGGGFAFIFQVTLYAALVAVAPFLMYHLYSFLRPALPAKAKRSAIKVVSLASVLMLCGVSFGYFIAVPAALRFLSTFAGSDILPNLTADSYLTFFLSYVAGLGLLFQLPLFLLLWHWINPFTPSGLLKSERFIILFAFVMSAIITPTPDIFNQAMIAVPLILIYQVGVIAILIALARAKRRAKPVQPPLVVLAKHTNQQSQPKIATTPSSAATLSQEVSSSKKAISPAGMHKKRSTDGFIVRSTLSPKPLSNTRKPQPIPYINRPSRVSSNRRFNRPVLSIDGVSTVGQKFI